MRALALAAVLGLAGCASAPEPEEPTAPPPRSRQDALALVEQARARLGLEDYSGALERLRRALDDEPDLAQQAPGALERRLDGLLADLDWTNAGARRDALSRKAGLAGEAACEAIAAFVEGRDVEAVLQAASAVGEDPQTEAYRALLASLSKRTGLEVPKEELLPRAALVQLKLQRAESAYREQRFGEAARECQEAVWLDKRNPLAWTRLGSTRWASGEPEKARAAYEQALALDPDNSEVEEFMQAKGMLGRGREAAREAGEEPKKEEGTKKAK